MMIPIIIPTFMAENKALTKIAINKAIGIVMPNLYFRSGELTIENNTKYSTPNTTAAKSDFKNTDINA